MSLIQKLFDKSVTHLLTQMEQSMDDEHNCVYRGPNGLKCAIGALIDDEWYDKETLEEMAITALCVQNAVAKSQGFSLSDLREEDWLILREVQIIHDEYLPQKWKDKLTALAEKHNLTMPQVP